MYIQGTISDFESRLHQLSLTSSDLSNFQTEGNAYLAGGFLEQLRWRWNYLFAKVASSVIGDYSYYLNPAFSENQVNPLQDAGGGGIQDAGGGEIHWS